jgi:HD-like signal output (HDOD) protein
MSNLAEVISGQVSDAVAKDQLELPTLPEVAMKIRDTAQSDDVSAGRLAESIAADPSLAARLIKVANSPMFRGTGGIEDLPMAVSRLGVAYAANLATGFAMQQMFQATSELVDRKLRAVWAHACEVAAISGVLAKTFTRLPADQATLAGLTHSIGVLPILTFAEENEMVIRDSMTLEKVIDSLHGTLGTMILKSWGFPDEVAVVPAQYTNFDRVAEEADLTDLVMVANLQTVAHTNHPFASLDWSTIRAFDNIGLDPVGESEELQQYHEDVAAAKSILG